MSYEYKVITAPTKGLRGKGVKGADGKFANALEITLNQLGAEGWEFQRAETLPSEERAGLTGKTTVFRTLLVFRRRMETDVSAFYPKLMAAPSAAVIAETLSAETVPAESAPFSDDNAPEAEHEPQPDLQEADSEEQAHQPETDHDDAENRA